MRALVTGGAGFIGSNIVDALIARGDTVCVLDNLSAGRGVNLTDALANGVELVEKSITESDAVADLIASFKPDVIFHLAAQIDVRKSIDDPSFDSAVNISGTINLLESARRHGVGRFVFSSTGGAIYGEADTIPTPEDGDIVPEAPYGQAKFAAEGYLGLFNRLYGSSTIALRYGNVYGPRQDPLGEAGVIAIFCGKAMQGERPTVFGDGTQTRDYIHVSDVVAANLLAADSGLTGALNIGAGNETSVLDLINALSPHATADFTPIFEPPRLGELPRSALDASKAKAELGWRPQIEIAPGLAATLDWARAAIA
ncbi:MAG TPA: NAD-dependent epimerase/dehydratase family protein [Solirubrobacterales bacterium]|nr:NAD-dependent epimerase/dehydratase family protein [Solirubrobacterales bacterium]